MAQLLSQLGVFLTWVTAARSVPASCKSSIDAARPARSALGSAVNTVQRGYNTDPVGVSRRRRYGSTWGTGQAQLPHSDGSGSALYYKYRR